MEDLVRIIRQKVRNINGMPVEEFNYYSSKNPPPAILRDLITNYEKLGFKKLDPAVYKSIRKRVNADGPSFSMDGTNYIAVLMEPRLLTAADLVGADLDIKDTFHNLDPERAMQTEQEKKKWETRKKEFGRKRKSVKIRMLESFVKEHVGIPGFKQEVKTARKLLKALSA